MEINIPFIEDDRCLMCLKNYDRRCISLTFKKPIILHKNATGVAHKICEKCLLTLMANDTTPIECPHCHNSLSLPEENQLPKKILKCKNAMFSDRGRAYRSVVYLANFIMPFYETCTMGINLLTSVLFGMMVYLEFRKHTCPKQCLLSLWIMLFAVNLEALSFPKNDNDIVMFRGENYKCCDFDLTGIRLFIILSVMGIMFCIDKLASGGITSLFLRTVFIFLFLINFKPLFSIIISETLHLPE